MDPPGTRYVQRDGHALAYQVVGESEQARDSTRRDVIWFFEVAQHLDLMWTDPHINYLLERGTTFARTTFLQRRGVGLSDPIDHVPTLEEQADDVAAVMDEVGIRHATMVGVTSTCGALCMLAARSPDRVRGLVLIQPFAESLLGTNRMPVGWDEASRARYIAGWRGAGNEWGTGASLARWDPAVDTPHNRRLMALSERCSATPATARAHFEWVFRLDYSRALPSVQCPARVLLAPASLVPRGAARHVADLIPHGRFHLLPPAPPGSSIGEAWMPVLEHVEEAATGMHRPADADRFLASLLFTDVVHSTETLALIGDVAYRDLRAAYERQVRVEVDRAGGRLVNVSGDGTFSVFDGPAAALRCAERICRSATALGIAVRAGVHTGEVEHTGLELTGMTVHVGARIGAAARPGEVLASRAVRDLVVGSGLSFVDRGLHELRGVPGRWSLYALDGEPETLPLARKRPTPNMIDRTVLGMARRTPRLLRTVATVANAAQRRTPRRGGTATGLD
ncbi:adenylate/guanylate cyclase domain-containing protein [Rhodococcus tukisamuensis]|uniref:Adenylate cyclase, class 3 n=1 Tax=Rhodococcus tukisamuensis TaxID=168276 RepID=A0A1G6LZR8_9NOCA|nr:adenylate/guanylate cyclase domain-containing protein [Rhodococcus tukisamuensis]SDC48788.1 Adenylate cyclase, class 3 [Rhodococcus tukisamuensis]